MKTIILVLLLFCSIFAQIELFDTKEAELLRIVSDLPRKYCPMRGFDGTPYCPEHRVLDSKKYNPDEDGITIIRPEEQGQDFKILPVNITESWKRKKNDPWFGSGFGYDRVTRQLKFPVLQSKTPVRVDRVHDAARRFQNVKELLTFMFEEKSTFEAGFYTMDDEFMKRIALQFSDYTIHVTATQRHVVTHESQLASNTPLSDFNQAISVLPPYDPNDAGTRELYKMIIQYWGTDVAIATDHGGVIYQQNILKACYGGSVTEDLIKDIDAAIKKVPPGDLAYLKYRKIGIFNSRGGNPEYGMDRINERIASFIHAPAPLGFRAVPLWQVVQDGQKREWLRQAIQDYINANIPNLENLNQQIENAKIANYKAHQTVYSFSFNVEQGYNLVVYWNGCPIMRSKKSVYCPHCTLTGPFPSMKHGDHFALYNSLGYFYNAERDASTGYARLVALLNNQTPVHYSPFVKTGCSTSPQFGTIALPGLIIDVSKRLHRAICIDCLPIIEQKPAQSGFKHTILNCVCPTF
jgi:hypothetical protein